MTISALSLSLLPSTSNGTQSLLDAVYGGVKATGNPVLALQSAVRDEAKGITDTAKEPQVKRDIAAFQAAVATAKTPAELLANPTARAVLLTANGLGDQAQYVALATKALLSDPSDPKSVANRLPDTRWIAVAKTFDFAKAGLGNLKSSAVLESIASGYAEVKWRQGLEQSTPGLSRAIDFRSRASGITSAVQILADPTFREVVTVSLGIPKQIAFQSIEAQERAILSKLDINAFKRPNFIEQFTRRYLIAAGNAAGSSQASGAAALFA